MHFIAHNFVEQTNEWEKIVGSKLHTRPIYLQEGQTLHHTRIAMQLLGIEDNEYHMKEYIYALANKIDWTLIFHNLPKIIDPTKRTEIVNILQLHQQSPLSLNRFMAFFAGKQLLPIMNTKYRDHFVASLRKSAATYFFRFCEMGGSFFPHVARKGRFRTSNAGLSLVRASEGKRSIFFIFPLFIRL